MSVAAKLHILLITTILGVGLYMFLLYKEIKMFEKEVADLRVKVHTIAASFPTTMANIDVVEATIVSTPNIETTCPAPTTVTVIADNNDIEDDNMSVTSNEIKEILTNIHDVSEEDSQVPVAEPQGVAASMTSVNPTDEVKAMTDEQIRSMKYEDLRSAIRKCNSTPKGSKADLIEQLLAIKNVE